MPGIRCYSDTSALLKWYIPEPGSRDFEHFLTDVDELVITRLAVVELRCALARRQRSRTITPDAATAAFALFGEDIAFGHITVELVADHVFTKAARLVEEVDVALRSLDALHLAAAVSLGVDVLATGDAIMRDAGERLGLEVAFFGAGA
jgi:predicted nucleic acid-binding protein